MPVNALREFFRLEGAGGILLGLAALAAIICDNTALKSLYDALLILPVSVAVGSASISKPLLLWINDGLMAVFFLLVGLELKREVLEGQLASKDQITLPALAALGGMAIPAAFYALVNWNDAAALKGWAIPAATDIAFALGILSLLGRRIPVTVKVFLTAIAIMDDLGAIVIIAAFYTSGLSWTALGLAGGAVTGLAILNLSGVMSRAPYLLIGLVLWVCVLKSGVHATLAGVVVALAIPLRGVDAEGHSPLRHLEHTLHPWVAFAILPAFAFANAGLPILDMRPTAIFAPIPLGIALGLFLGKQLGVFGATYLVVRCGLTRLPADMDWHAVYGTALLTGVGFTMSLFIGSLAFDTPETAALTRLGVLAGSLLSGITGFLVLARRYRTPADESVAFTQD